MHRFHPYDPIHVGNQNSIVDNITKGIYVQPDHSRDPRLVGFVECVLHPQPFRRFRGVDAVIKHLGMDDVLC